ncbi:MAG: DUF4373 domain-containing protein [Sporomusaceae bacterium]|nr:DUF4373 domain-containing protein [Sporomusaceae bacterium]
MARPTKEGMDYFPHDTDASNDEKIEALRALYGNDGYAFYFILLERIYRVPNAEMDVSKPAVLAALIAKIGVSREKFEKMLDTAFDLECLDRDIYEQSQILTSHGIKKRAREVQKLRDKWRKAKVNTEEKPTGIPAENTEENCEENPAENGQLTGESKGKESKENISSTTSACTRKEVCKLFQQEVGVLSPIMADKLNAAIDDYSPWWVYYAIQRAALQGKRSMAYILAVLAGWKADGFAINQQPWEAHRSDQYSSSGRSRSNKASPRTKPDQTDWSNEPDHL